MNKHTIGRYGRTEWSRHDVTLRVAESLRRELGLSALSWPEIVNLDLPDPAAFTSPEEFRDAYWRSEVLSKVPFDIGIDRRAAARQSFDAAERACALANERLCSFWERPVPEWYRSVFRRAQSLLAHLFRGFSVDEVVSHVRWGPGASTSMPRAQASHQNKWVKAAHMTSSVEPYFRAFCEYSGWIFPEPKLVAGNKVVFVPKNAKTERTIAIEPDWNCFFQLGMGGAIRARLQRKFGLLKPIAQQVNQRLAQLGSRDGFLATVDLKGASDSVSVALCEALLPTDVFNHLMALRSPHGVFEDGTSVSYEKISSMGNGFTFELETALFYCLARAACGHAVVYGDDIVVPATTVGPLRDLLAFAGFTMNDKKTHYDNPFRESCGGHFFKGVDVSPPYLRKQCVGVSRIGFANQLRYRSTRPSMRTRLLKGSYDLVCRGIPRSYRGPAYGDGLVSSLDEARPSRSRALQTYQWKTLRLEYRAREAPPTGGLRQALFGAPGFLEYHRDSGVERCVTRRQMGPWLDPEPWI